MTKPSAIQVLLAKRVGLPATASKEEVCRAAFKKMATMGDNREWRGWIVKKGSSSRIASVQVWASSSAEAKEKAVAKMLDMDYPAAKYEIGGVTDADLVGTRGYAGDAGANDRR